MTYAMRTLWHSGGFLFSHKIFTDLKHCEFCAIFVLFCAAYAEFYATPLMADNDTCDMSRVHCGILAHISAPSGFSLAL